MKANTLGFANEMMRVPRTSVAQVDVEMAPADASSSALAVLDCGRLDRSNMLCCALTTILVVSGIAIGSWFAMTHA